MLGVTRYAGPTTMQQSANGIERAAYEDTEHYTITRDFLNSPERYFKRLLQRSAGDAADE